MTHLDLEIKRLKTDMIEMFHMVSSQLNKAKEALITLDKDLALEVMENYLENVLLQGN